MASTYMPNQAPASCSAFPRQYSDGTEGCSVTDRTACEYSSASNRRYLLKVIENGDSQTYRGILLLRGSEIRRYSSKHNNSGIKLCGIGCFDTVQRLRARDDIARVQMNQGKGNQ